MKPIIAITMGDPAGIGSEISVKVLSDKKVYDLCKPLIIGASRAIADALRITNSDLEINIVNKPSEGLFEYGKIDLINLNNIEEGPIRYGTVDASYGKAAGEYIKKAIELALEKEVDATVTGPIHKKAFNDGGWNYAGHTEMFAALTNTAKYVMMLTFGNLRTAHVTTHVPLRDVVDFVKKERILDVIRIAHSGCRKLGLENPKIAVGSLNPHASDGGLMGDEEKNEIIPAIEDAKKEGFSVDGPIPADTVFTKLRAGMYDIVISMYHDSGHIPMKFAAFDFTSSRESPDVAGVNITLGIPIIRTAVEHGTAFGKAGKGTASPLSLAEALNTAVIMVKNWDK